MASYKLMQHVSTKLSTIFVDSLLKEVVNLNIHFVKFRLAFSWLGKCQ